MRWPLIPPRFTALFISLFPLKRSMTIARKLALLVLCALLGMVVMTAWFLVSERKLIL